MSRDVTMWLFITSCSRLRSCFLLSWYTFRSAEQEEHFCVKQREKYLHFHPNTPTLELTEAPQRSWLRLNSCFRMHSSRSSKCLTPNLTKKGDSVPGECCVKVATRVDVSNVIKLLLWGRLTSESQTLWLNLSSRQAPTVSDQLINVWKRKVRIWRWLPLKTRNFNLFKKKKKEKERRRNMHWNQYFYALKCIAPNSTKQHF